MEKKNYYIFCLCLWAFFRFFGFFFSGSFGYLGFPTLWILWMLCDTLTSHLNFCSRIYADVFWILSIWHLIRPWLLIINLCVNVYHCLLFFLFCFCPCLLSSVSFALLFLSVCPNSCFSCFVFSKPDPVCNRFTHCYLAFSSAICFANIHPCQRPLKCYNHCAHHLFSLFSFHHIILMCTRCMFLSSF